MSAADEESSSALNGRLRPRKSNVPSPQALKPTRSADGKSAQDKPKGASPSASAPDDLTTKSELSSTPQFLCPYCDKNFASKQTVSKHVHRVHLSSSKQDTSLDCLFCNHAEVDANIVRHMVDSHPNQYFACLDCHTRFPSTTELANHKLNICEKQKVAYNSRLRPKVSTGAKKNKKLNFDKKDEYSEENKDFRDDHGFNGIVISCELKPSQVHDEADIEDNITTNLILPPCKSLVGSAGLEKNAVIVLDDIQWNKRIPPNFSFHNTDHTADQILSRLGVVHRSPRTGESTRRNWLKSLEDTPLKFEKCFDTSFYSKVASNVQENLTKYLDGSFNFNPDPHNTIKTRKLKNSVAINTAEGFPILLASEQYSRSVLDSYLPRCIAPKHKWKWDNPDGDRNPLNADQLKRDSHVNNCIITLVSSLDIWTQLSMRRKFEDKFRSLPIERKLEKKNIIGKELKEILESREIPSPSQVVLYSNKPAPNNNRLDFPASLGLAPSAPAPNLQPAVLSGEWVRPRCYVCCACGAQTRDPRALSSHNSTHHPNSQVQHYEIVGEPLLNADIMQHLYVPPKQMGNRTRPPRGIKDCTKCGKPISLEELHQHMLDCAGDTPTVRRRTCRYRPFGVRKRRARLPDNTIRKKIRKDIRTSQGRQKKHMRSRQKIRSEVGDAETIRKMLADLPAKRHRVMINPMNMIPRPRRKMEQQRSKMLLKKRPTHNRSARKTFNAHSSDNGSQSASANSDDPNKNSSRNDEDEDNKPLKPRIKRVIHKVTMHNDTLKRQTLFNERKSKRPKRKPIRMKQQREAEEPSESASSPPPNSGAPSFKEISVGDDSHRIDVRRGPYNTREQANRGGGGTRGGGGNFGGGSNRGGGDHRDDQQPGGSRSNENPENNYAPSQNAPLKHSIASLTSNSETQDKAVQFHHLFLVQQECNDANQHVPTGRQTLFENEAVVTKLDKPPLSCSQRAQADYYALQKNNKLNKTRKGLNDCIAMLKNKLVDPVPEMSTGHVSVQCGSDEPIGPLMPSQMTSDLVGISSVSPRGSFEMPHIFIPPPNQLIGVGSEMEIYMKQPVTVNKQDSLYSTGNQLSLIATGKQPSPISTGKHPSPIYDGNEPSHIYPGNQQSHISASNQLSPIKSGNQHNDISAGNQHNHISAGNQQRPISAGKEQSSSSDSKQQSPVSDYTQQSPNSDNKQQIPTSYKQPSPNASKRQPPGKRAKRRSNSDFMSQEQLVPQKVYQTRGIRRSQRRSTAQFDYDKAQTRSLQYGPDIGISSQKSLEYLYQEARRKSIEELSEIAIALQKPTDYQLYERAYRKSAERNLPPRNSPQKSIEYQHGDNAHGKIVEPTPEIRISPRKSTEYHPYYEIPQTKRIDRSPVFGVSPQKPVEYPYQKVTQKNIIPEVHMTPTQPGYNYNDLRKHLRISPEISITQQKPDDYLYCQIAPINSVGHYAEMQISPQRPVPYQYCELVQKKSARRSVEMQVSPQKYITTQYRGQPQPPMERVPEIEVNPHVFDENKFREIMQNHPIEFGPEISNGQQNLIEGRYLSPPSQKPEKIKTSRSSSQKSRTNSETEVQRFSDIYPTNDNFLLKPVIPSEVDKAWRKNNESLPRESSTHEQILPEAPLNAQENVYLEVNVDFVPQPSNHPDRDSHLPPESFSDNVQMDIHNAHGGICQESAQESVPLDLSKTTATNESEKIPTSDYLVYNYDTYETIDLIKNSSDEDVLIDVENDGVVDLSVKPAPPGYESDTLDLCMKTQVDNVPTDLSMKRNENVSNNNNNIEESQPIVDFPGQKTTLPELEHHELTQSYNDVTPTDLSSKIDKTIPERIDTNNKISTDTTEKEVRENSRVTYDFLEHVTAPSKHGNRGILEDEFQRPSKIMQYQVNRNECLTPVSNVTRTPSELNTGDTAVSYANVITTHIAVTICDNLPSGLKPTICTTSEASSVNDLPVNKKLEESDLVYKHGNASYSESIIETSTPTVTKLIIPESITRDNPPQSTDSVHIADKVTVQKTTPVSLQNQKKNQTDQEKETKDIDPTLDNDPETAKKIALLPKELVDILGNMPVDHRNQLLNILPQYVSTPTISSTSPNSSIQTTTNTTAPIPTAVSCQQTTVTKATTISQTETTQTTPSIPQPAASPDQLLNAHLMKSQPNIKYDIHSNALAKPMSVLVKPQSSQEDKSTSPQVSPLPGKEISNSDKSGVNDYNHAPLLMTYDYKLSNNEAKHVSSDISRSVSIPNPNLTNITDNEKCQIQKKSNDQTASLRAVRIKAPSERQKDSQILKRSSIEQLSKPNIKETDVSEPIIEKSLAIQQAEVSSTQHNNKNDEGEALISEAYDADLELNNTNIKTQRLSTLTPDAVIASMPENNNDQIDGPTKNEVPKQSVVTSSISCLKYDSENLTNSVILNETIIEVSKKEKDTLLVESKFDDISPPKALVPQDAMIDTSKKDLIQDSTCHEINEIEFEDDSDDDISLAAIVKQKHNQQKISQCVAIVEESVSRINENNERSKKKKKNKKHKKERKYNQVADNLSHKIDTSLIIPTVAYSSSDTCETESTLHVDNTTEKDSMEENYTPLNTTEKLKQQNLDNDIDKDTISVTSKNTIEKEDVPVGDVTEGVKTLKHGVNVDPTSQEISSINGTEVITKKIRLNEIADSIHTLKSSHLDEYSTCDSNSSHIKNSKKLKSIKKKKRPCKSLNNTLTSQNDNDINLTSLPETNLIKDCINNETSKDTEEEHISNILENNIDEQTKASDPVPEPLKLNSETNLSTAPELDMDNTTTPLRRSRRGKSLFVYNDFTEQSKTEKETESIDQKTPFTKKQLIFSKLLHDEEINAKLSLDESVPKEMTNEDNSDKNLSLDATTSLALPHANERLNTSESLIDNKSIKRKKSPHIKRKSKKKKILGQGDCIQKPRLASNSDKNEISEQASRSVSKDVKKSEKSDEIAPINEAANTDTSKDKNTELNDNQLLIFIEKRKSNNDRNNDDCQSSRAKKIKFNKNLENPVEETEIRSNKTLESENKESPKASATRPTMCYNMPVASRRTRSKSVVEKTTNTDLYDPYNIDLDEMDEKTEPFRATGFMPKNKINFKASKSKLAGPKSDNKQESLIEISSANAFNLGAIKAHSKKSKCETIVSGEYAKTISKSKKDVVDEFAYNELHTADDISNDSVKGNISDSDDSTRSDVPLKKYVEEKQRKMAKLNNTLEKETEHTNHSDSSSDKSNSKEIKKKQKNLTVCKNVSTVSILNEEDEQLRSEQFMESFGFFSQRKPRKSNLLASKKIAATFHVIANDNDDMYFGPNQRITRKNPQSSSSSRRVTRRTRQVKKKNCDKTLSCLCRICQKLFRRPDNLMRHQLTLLHVSRLSELDLKLKTNCIPEEPNYLCAFKQYLDRLKRIAVKMGKYKKNPRFKLKMPTVKEIIENVHKGVLDQRVTSRNLSRDEALFLDCCELLKESHRNNVPRVTSFLPNHLFCAPKAAGTSRKSVEAMFKEDKPGETTANTCVCNHKPGDTAPHSPTCPQNPVNAATHSSTCPYRSVNAATHSPDCPHNPRNALPHSSNCPLRSGDAATQSSACPHKPGEVVTHSSACLHKTGDAGPYSSACPDKPGEAAPHSSTCPHKPGDAAPHLSTCPHKNEAAAPHSSACPHKPEDAAPHSSACPHKSDEAATHSSACSPKPEETKDDGDVDSITAKAILESEEVRKLEKDLISVFKTARPGTFGSLNINNQSPSQDRGSPTATVTSAINQAADIHDYTRKESKDVDPGETPQSDTVKAKKQIEVKEKMYPDVEEFDMFEDKFDKIKRKSRSQAAAAKMSQPAVHTSVRQATKKSDTKKGKKRNKKKSPSTVLTKGALKGFDSLKVSIPTSDINISALTQAPESPPKRKRKATPKKKKNKAETDTAARSHADDAQHRTSPKKDVYEFRDNEDAELFEFRPSTVMERFKLINNKEMERFKTMSHKDDEKAKNTGNKEVDRFKGLYAKEMERFKTSSSKRTETYTSKNYPGTDFDMFSKYGDAIASTSSSSKEAERFKITSKDQSSTSKAHLDYGLGDVDDDSSQSASDGDDFVYMSDHSDEVCSDDETGSTMSSEIGKVDLKKNTSPLKRKDAIEKNVVMGKIFKHNAVRAEKRIVKVNEPAKPNIDQLFDSLLDNEKQNTSAPDRRADSPDGEDTAEEDETPKYEPLSVNVYDSLTANKKSLYTSPKKSCTVSPHKFEPTPSTSFASRYQQDSPERSEVSTNRYKMPSQSRYVDPYEFGPSTSKKPDPSIDLAYPSTSKQYDLDFLPKDTKYSSPKKNESAPWRSYPLPAFDGPSTSKATSGGGREKARRETEESNDGDAHAEKELPLDEDAGVARQRARRKCTVGKQNVLAESWSSESEPDGAPPRPGSAQSDSSGAGRRKRGKRKDGPGGGRRGKNAAGKKGEETRVSSDSGPAQGGGGEAREARAPTPPGAFVAPAPVAGGGPAQAVVGPDGKLRSVAYYWSSEGDEEQEHLQQHGWIVGDSHKKLVTMLAHAKGRKRNNDDKCHSE